MRIAGPHSVPCNRLAKIWGVQHPVRLFIAALFRSRWQLIACGVFTVLGVYTAATMAKVWLVGGSGFVAAAFFSVAVYHAWREEHDKHTGDVASYQSPDISGEAFNFSGYRIQGNDRTDC
jgi:hypothetical protein